MHVLLIDHIHPQFSELLVEQGFSITDGTKLSVDEILQIIDQFDGVQLRSRIKIDKSIINRCPKLRFIARAGAGMESIDVEYAETKGIQCINSPEGNKDAVAEHALGMLLMLFNKLHIAHAQLCRGEWNRESNRGIELAGKTIGIIGYGNMGQAFAERLKGFGVRIMVYDKYKTGFQHGHIQEVPLETLFAEADVLSVHTPLTNETKYMINQEFLARFSKPIYVINTARGKIVHTQSLVEALQKGQVLGACLDVLEYENHSFEHFDTSGNDDLQYLINSERVVLTPHIAGWTQESYYKIAAILAQKIIHQFKID